MELTARAKALLHKAADQIEREPKTFDMASWCGTSCCVAGHISKAAQQRQYSLKGVITALDLSEDDFWNRDGVLDHLFLFHGKGSTLPDGRQRWPLHDVPADQAVRTMRHFAETGEVDWSVGAALESDRQFLREVEDGQTQA